MNKFGFTNLITIFPTIRPSGDDNRLTAKASFFRARCRSLTTFSPWMSQSFHMTIYFYKVNEPYGCFSNFSPHGIHIHGQYWPTVEHYYQAQKFVGTNHEPIIKVIHGVKTPEEAASLGRDPVRQVRPDWEDVKLPLMREAVLTKFLTHLDIQAILLDTGDRLLVENSATDYYWGCGKDKTGQNHLGKILISVRQEIQQRLTGLI